MQDKILKALSDAVAVKQQLLASEEIRQLIEAVALRIVAVFRQGGRVFFCGNGGSAADAQHLAAELTGRYYKDRPPLPAEALHVNTSFLTAVANDYSYEETFARLLRGWGR